MQCTQFLLKCCYSSRCGLACTLQLTARLFVAGDGMRLCSCDHTAWPGAGLVGGLEGSIGGIYSPMKVDMSGLICIILYHKGAQGFCNILHLLQADVAITTRTSPQECPRIWSKWSEMCFFSANRLEEIGIYKTHVDITSEPENQIWCEHKVGFENDA